MFTATPQMETIITDLNNVVDAQGLLLPGVNTTQSGRRGCALSTTNATNEF
jgi:hypothetical protein